MRAFVGIQEHVGSLAGVFIAGRAVGLELQNIRAHQAGYACALLLRFHAGHGLHAQGHGAGVGIELLGLGHELHRAADAADALGGEGLQGELALETVDAQAAVGAHAAHGGQRVVGAAGVVARAFAAVVTQEDGPGVDGFLSHSGGVLHGDDEMLGGVSVGKINGVLLISQHDDAAVGNGLGGHFPAGQLRKLLLHLGSHGFGHGGIGGDQHGLAVRAVLGLAQQVCRHKGRHAAGIGQHFHLAGACRHVDGHTGQGSQLLGGGHIGIARAENLIHLRHRGGAVGHGGDGLSPAHLEDAGHAAEIGRKEDGGIHLAILAGGRAEHHFLAPGHSGGHRQHEHRGEQRRLTTGHIQAHALNGQRALLAFHTGGGLQFHGSLGGMLQFVEVVDVAVGQFDGLLKLLRHAAAGFLHLGGGNGQGFQIHAIKTVTILMQRLVTMHMHGIHDGAHHIKELRYIEGRAAHQLRPLFTSRFRYDGHGNQEITESFFRWGAPGYPGHRLP